MVSVLLVLLVALNALKTIMDRGFVVAKVAKHGKKRKKGSPSVLVSVVPVGAVDAGGGWFYSIDREVYSDVMNRMG